ncbi:hypothetical protein FHT09_002347 [Xanthomonas arboricola]|nr:hypothetical protein [Xanthomonas sp. CFBP 8152]
MPPRSPQPARTPRQGAGRWPREKLLVARVSGSEPAYQYLNNAHHALLLLFLTVHTDYLDWSLPAHRRGTLSGMDAAPEPTRTYLRHVPRWWAGKGPAAKPQIVCSAPDIHTVQSPFKATKSSRIVWTLQSRVGRVRGALTARGTRRESVRGGSLAASMPPRVPQSARTPHQKVGRWLGEKPLVEHMSDLEPAHQYRNVHHALLLLFLTVRTDHLDGSLPAHRRGTLSGMDAAPEPTWTYLRRVPRWWAGKGPAANLQTSRSATNASPSFNHLSRRSRSRVSVVFVSRS